MPRLTTFARRSHSEHSPHDRHLQQRARALYAHLYGQGKRPMARGRGRDRNRPEAHQLDSRIKADARRNKLIAFQAASLATSIYRPFNKQWLYFNRQLNEMVLQTPKLFPTPEHKNIVISSTGVGAIKAFSALATKYLPDYELISKRPMLPLYWYEKSEERRKSRKPSYPLTQAKKPQINTAISAARPSPIGR